MQTVYEAAGGEQGLLRLARRGTVRVVADEVVSHAFSHGFRPDHTERWRRIGQRPLGGPISTRRRTATSPPWCESTCGNGPHEEMNRRAIACFDQALSDVGFTQPSRVRQVLREYFSWATSTTMSRYRVRRRCARRAQDPAVVMGRARDAAPGSVGAEPHWPLVPAKR
jgi:hemoglobin